MNIIFDNIVFNLQRSGGISVVWYELLKRIEKEPIGNVVQYVDNYAEDNYYRHLLDINKELIIATDRYPSISRYLSVSLDSQQPLVFHSSYYRYCNNPNARNVTTVHDFTYEYYRTGFAKSLHCWQKYRAIRHSDIVVCISENTKKDLLRFVPDIKEDKVRVIYNGISEEYCVLDSADGYILPFEKETYVVFVGNRKDNYKNFDLLKRCISSTPYSLVIVGSGLTDEEDKDLRKYVPDGRYKCMGFLPNEELNIIYNNAAALVYPSEYEGFGIPVIEAQRAGCPVIAYNSSSIPEIIGKTPLLMDEISEKELIGKMSMLSDKPLMCSVIFEGLANSKRFSWDKMCRQYVDLYKELLNDNHHNNSHV